MNKNGFTLVEILTAVVIVGILVTMAVPLYEKTIERSRLTEARAVLNRMQSAKRHAMDNMECYEYSTTATDKCPVPPKLKHLNIQFQFKNAPAPTDFKVCSETFCYSLAPGGDYIDGVCAKRRGGDYANTVFVYRGESEDITKNEFWCSGSFCEDYGIPSKDGLSCN